MAGFDPISFGAGAGLSLLGGYLSDERADDRAAQNIDAQREFATHGVQWRVQDALAAGVHPLFALGGAGAAFSPNPIAVNDVGAAMTGMGQNLSRAAMATQTELDREAKEAQVRLINAQAGTEVERQALLRAQTGKLQAPNPPFPDLGDSSGWVGSQGGGQGQGGGSQQGEIVHQGGLDSGGVSWLHNRRSLKPSEMVSRSERDESTEAATGVHWKSWQLTHGGGVRPMVMDLPAANSASEAWEAIGESFTLWMLTVSHNIRKYGQQWWLEFQQKFPHVSKALVEEDPGMLARFTRAFRPWGQ